MGFNQVIPDSDIIDAVSDWCRDSENEGSSNFPGMSYEQGVLAAIDWMLGHTTVAPNED